MVSGRCQRKRASGLSPSAITTFLILLQQSDYRTFKGFNTQHVQTLTALQASLDAASVQLSSTASASANTSANNGDTQAACNDLAAFVNKVNALVTSGRLTTQQGATLLDPASSLMGQVCD